MVPSPPSMQKTALITVGATAPFPLLVTTAIHPSILNTLHSLGYTHLLIQHGLTPFNFGGTPIGGALLRQLSAAQEAGSPLTITAFDFSPDLSKEIALSDLVISHAGAGSILDALRLGKRLLVVPNGELMHNHQKELAEELERQGYLIEGSVATLHEDIKKAEAAEFKHFPKSGSETFGRIVEEEMGFQNEG